MTRCLMVSDDDELGLLSKARPLMAKPLSAVTQTRDGFVGNNSFLFSYALLFGVEGFRRLLAEPPSEEMVQTSCGCATC